MFAAVFTKSLGQNCDGVRIKAGRSDSSCSSELLLPKDEAKFLARVCQGKVKMYSSVGFPFPSFPFPSFLSISCRPKFSGILLGKEKEIDKFIKANPSGESSYNTHWSSRNGTAFSQLVKAMDQIYEEQTGLKTCSSNWKIHFYLYRQFNGQFKNVSLADGWKIVVQKGNLHLASLGPTTSLSASSLSL